MESYENQGLAQADPRYLSKGIGEAVPPQPFTDATGVQLDHLRKCLTDIRGDLGMLHDRMFGNPNQTAAAQGVAPAPPLPSARTDAIAALIGMCQFEVNEIGALARGLNGRL